MRHRVNVVPVRVRVSDTGLRCDRLRVVGYRAVCECGERSQVRATVRHARVWRADHLNPSKDGVHI